VKILFVVHQYLPDHRAGTEVYTHSLAKEMSKRHEVAIYCHEAKLDGGSEPALMESYEGITVRRVAAWLGDNRPSSLRLFRDSYRNPIIEADYARYLAKFNPDIVHVQHLKDMSAGILGCTADADIPIVMTLHDYWTLCANAQCVRPNGHLCERTLLRLQCGLCAAERLGQPLLKAVAPAMMPLFWARDRYLREQLAYVDRFIAPSAFLRYQYTKRGYSTSRVLRVENGLDLSRLSAAAAQPRGPYRGHYAYIGSLAWQKGIHVLVEAFRRLGDVGATLKIWGNQAIFPAYVEQLRQRAAGFPWIQLEGEIHHDRVGEVLAWADYLLVPSLWWENSPVTIREAYATGVPVIASRLGSLAAKVFDNQSGLLFEPGSASSLQQVLTRTHRSPALLESLRANLPPVISIEQHAQIIEGIYRSVQREK